ncbi:heme biosynthesis protein HemY [Comamonas sp. NLF-1-9]|uniref:heme biosynthesis protein HemY n=1 Tax=Comamonas sp. NLF-1-9 TaxID=2853163 RepID=UPI001C472BEB|nr:heme biosynthesis HemY N-terminal domain-containing protein [Comamonas sp. NLF-1-9]QXL85514.1 heme biosynthesis protein HemY [Comamonas sp. NLF-1-9]
MRAALWFLALFGAAVAVAVFAGNNQGTVTVFWPPWRIDLSLNLVLVLLFAAILLIYGALHGLSALRELPRQARRWRQQQKERAMHGAMLDAIAQLLAGRFVRARKAAQAALAQQQALAGADKPPPHGGQLRTLAHVVAAESSHALQDRSGRSEHLALALEALGEHPDSAGQELREGVQLRSARWLLDERDAEGALERLAALPQGASRRTLALRTRLKAARLAGRTRDALETARLLAKHRAFSPEVASTLVRTLAVALLDETRDDSQLHSAWQALEPQERTMPEVAIHAARRHLQLGGSAAQARQWLLPAWEQYDTLQEHQRHKLALALEASLEGMDSHWLGLIEARQRSQPRDPALQYLAAGACRRMQLWGKAEQLYSDASQSASDAGLRARAWCQLAELAERRGDAPGAAQAWKRAAQSR